jgi:hypothetical protein
MERCLDCNSVLTIKEKVCPTCGAKVGLGALSPAELFARAGTVAFYGAVLAFLDFHALTPLPWSAWHRGAVQTGFCSIRTKKCATPLHLLWHGLARDTLTSGGLSSETA